MDNFNIETAGGLLSRCSSLLNSPCFSDVQFKVKDGLNGFELFHAHKLILAMAGEGFKSLFYIKAEETRVVDINDSTPRAVYLMLRYLYTDKLDLKSLDDTFEVAKLAKTYFIKDLIEECNKYIKNIQINADTLFSIYDYALLHTIHPLLEVCRKFACRQTSAVFSSDHFLDASMRVVEDIFAQDNLSVKKELDIIYAAMRYSQRECKRMHMPIEGGLRLVLNHFLKHLRFLCLTAEDFCEFVEENNIFSSHESTLLTTKILMPNSRVKLPEGFCVLSQQRGLFTDLIDTSVFTNNSSDFDNTSIKQSKTYDTPAPKVNYPPLFFDQQQPLLAKPKSPQMLPTKLDNSNLKTSKFDDLLLPTKLDSRPVSSCMYAFSTASTKPPMLKVIPQRPTYKTFEFPLHEMPNQITSHNENDIKCNATIKMLKGSITIHGIELKISEVKTANNEEENNIEVFLCISGKFPTKHETFNQKLKNNIMLLSFAEPIRVQENNPVNIEVIVEDLKMSRCSVLKDQTLQLNSGLSVAAKVSLESNQFNTGSNVFLISRLMYSTS